MQHRKIAFIGAGNMAHAIIAGLVSHGYPASMITVCSPTPVRREKSPNNMALSAVVIMYPLCNTPM